jgi:hypothetical protein
MMKNTQLLLIFLSLVLILTLSTFFLYTRLNPYNATNLELVDESPPVNINSLTTQVQEDKKRVEYVNRHLHRGYFENYNSTTNTLSILAETRVGTELKKQIKQFEISKNKEVLCWPQTVPGVRSSWQDTYIALEQNGFLYLSEQQPKLFNLILNNLTQKNYIFIHELGGVIQEIAVTGCAN